MIFKHDAHSSVARSQPARSIITQHLLYSISRDLSNHSLHSCYLIFLFLFLVLSFSSYTNDRYIFDTALKISDVEVMAHNLFCPSKKHNHVIFNLYIIYVLRVKIFPLLLYYKLQWLSFSSCRRNAIFNFERD